MNFKNFKVYKDAKSLVVLVFRLTRKLPKDFYYLSDQINRASLSIVLNIAEGSGKNSDKDFNRYIKNALGSATEVVAALEIINDLQLVNLGEITSINILAIDIIKQLGGFSKFLSKN